MSESSKRTLAAIFVVGFMLRLSLMLIQPLTPAFIDRLPDQREYLTLAENLIQHHSLFFVDPRFGQQIFAYRMPGYPLFLAFLGASIPAVRIAQIAVDLSTVLAVFLISRKVTGTALGGLIAATLMALNPFYIFFSTLLLSETLFASLITWALYAMICLPGRWKLAFVTLAAAAYVRPTGLILLPLMFLALSLKNLWSKPYFLSVRRIRCLIFPAVFFFLILLPWCYRNHHVLGRWIWITTNSGITLYDGFNWAATGASDQRFIGQNPALMSMSEVQRSESLQAAAESWARSHLRELPWLSLEKLARGWSPVPLSSDFGKPGYRLISGSYSIPFDFLCLVGLVSRQVNWRLKLLIAMPALVVTVAQVLSVGSIRYRMPAEAALSVLASCGALYLLGRIKDLKAHKVELAEDNGRGG